MCDFKLIVLILKLKLEETKKKKPNYILIF